MPNKHLAKVNSGDLCGRFPGVNIPTSGFQYDKDQLTETLIAVSWKLVATGSITPLPHGGT